MVAPAVLRSRVSAALVFCIAVGQPAQARADAVTLEDCIQQALKRAPAVLAADADNEAAAARMIAARAAYLPQLGAHAEYGRSYGFDEAVTNGGSTATVVTLDATLLDGGMRSAQLAAARARIRSAAAVERQRQADVAGTVAAAYFSALEARREVEIHGDHLDMLRESARLLQRQADLGLVARNDALRTQLAVQAAVAAQRAAAAQVDSSLRELEILVGTPLAAESLLDNHDLSEAPETAPTSIDASPLVADALAAAEAAQRDAEAARAQWMPRLTLSASGGALGVKPGTTFRDDAGGQFLVGVTMPLFDGGALGARIAEADAVARSAAVAAEETRQTVTTTLARARIEADRARADANAWTRTIEQAAENLALMRTRYAGGGDVRLLEVLDALAQSVDTRVNAARAELAYHLATATRHQLLGEIGP